METYNNLLKEFCITQGPINLAVQYKSISNDLTISKNRKKNYLFEQKRQLNHLKTEPDKQKSQKSFISIKQFCNNSRITCTQMEYQSISRKQLQHEILNLQNQINLLNSKNQELSCEFGILVDKSPYLENIEKESQLSIFNHSQQIGIQAAIYQKEQYKEQQIVCKFKKKRQQVREQIQKIVSQNDNAKKLLKRCKISRKDTINPLVEVGMPTKELYNMLKNIYLLAQLQISYDKTEQFDLMEIQKQVIQKEIAQKMSKAELLDYFTKKGYFYDEISAESILRLYQNLQTEFDRNERAQKQILSYYQQLKIKIEKLRAHQKKLTALKQENSINTLKQYQIEIKSIEQQFQQSCNKISKFTTQLYQLVNKLQGFMKTLENIMLHPDSGGRYLDISFEPYIAQRYAEILFKNPQELILSWDRKLEKESLFYTSMIKENNLLRLYTSPEHYWKGLDDLQNYQVQGSIALIKNKDFISEMFRQIIRILKLLKHNKNMDKVETNTNASTICIESKQYYRRDNFKIIEKMERDQLRKKGLLINLPINLQFQTELIAPSKYHSILSPQSNSSSRLFPRQTLKYTNRATKIEESSRRKQHLIKMIYKLDSINNRSGRVKMRHQNETTQRTTLNLNTFVTSFENKSPRVQRKTEGQQTKERCTQF